MNWVPWIHIADEVGIIIYLLKHPELQGPFNLSAPHPIQYRDYASFMGETAGKPANRKMPALFTQMFMGKAADMVLHNRRMLPQRILQAGYIFKFPQKKTSLDDLLTDR